MVLSRSMGMLIVASAATFAVACSDGIGPPPGLPHSSARATCGPTDGPAVLIYLAAEPIGSLPSAPYVRIHIIQPLESLAGRSWVLTGPNADGFAVWHSTASDSEGAMFGTVRIFDVDAENTIEGEVDLIFPEAGRVAGEFRARWVTTILPPCG